ncbi:MAG TPA: 2-C-methyl-D-erythritol 4-phosphate cytidylyltransferase [Pyrinomonadaceae bacterium]
MNVAIVVAAGKGTRLGGARPKQFLELRGVPVIIHTLRQFERCQEINEVITVLPAQDTAGFASLTKQFEIKKAGRAVAGGATRAQSVRNGLNAIADADIVAVHDGVRPFVTPEEIDQVVAAAREKGAAVLTSPVADTIKRVQDGRIIKTVARAELRRALTPQCFRFAILKRAYETLDELESTGLEVTDDSFLVERIGIAPTAVNGSARNIKITNEEDLKQAEALL